MLNFKLIYFKFFASKIQFLQKQEFKINKKISIYQIFLKKIKNIFSLWMNKTGKSYLDYITQPEISKLVIKELDKKNRISDYHKMPQKNQSVYVVNDNGALQILEKRFDNFEKKWEYAMDALIEKDTKIVFNVSDKNMKVEKVKNTIAVLGGR